MTYAFGPFRLESASCRLLRNGEPVPLPPKVFDALLFLVRNSDRVVTKQELMQHLWPDVFVQEDSLVRVIFLLRKALGADFVLTGTARTVVDKRMMITARLLRVVDGVSLWADAYQERLDDVDAVEDSIVEAARQALGLRTTPEERRRRWGTASG